MFKVYYRPRELVGIFLIFAALPVTFFYYASIVAVDYMAPLLVTEAILVSIILFITFSKQIILFEPIFLFSFYYTTVFLSCFYLIINNFDGNYYIENTTFRSNLPNLITYASSFYLLSYLSMLAGYFFIKDKKLVINFDVESNKISATALNTFISIYLMIGIGNFIINVYNHAGGNLLEYMSNISTREYEFEVSGTTIGYYFSETAMFIWFYKLAKNKFFASKSFIMFFLVVVLIKISCGRVFAVVVYVASFVGVYYYIKIDLRQKINNVKYYFVIAVLALAGIAIYFLRLISSLNFNDKLINVAKDQFVELIGRTGDIALNMGYIPNTGLLMKIIDSWAIDVGYLYGESFVTWIYNVLPSALKPTGYQMSVIIPKIWYENGIPLGSMPPTGIGEMYANFGVLGPVFGMFVFGCIVAFMYNYMLRSRSYWVLVACIQISIGFISIYPKGEFDNLSFITVLPIMFSVIGMRLFDKICTPVKSIRHVKTASTS